MFRNFGRGLWSLMRSISRCYSHFMGDLGSTAWTEREDETETDLEWSIEVQRPEAASIRATAGVQEVANGLPDTEGKGRKKMRNTYLGSEGKEPNTKQSVPQCWKRQGQTIAHRLHPFILSD